MKEIYVGEGKDKGRIKSGQVAHEVYNTISDYAEESGEDKVGLLNKHGENVLLIGQAAKTVQESELRDFDEATGLYNQKGLEKQLNRILSDAARKGGTVTVFWVDVDNFKKVNDELGHPVGDAVIVQTARLLEHGFRQGDIVARVGGDEFVIVVYNGQADLVSSVQDRLTKNLESKATEVSGMNMVGLSMGYDSWQTKEEQQISEGILQLQERLLSHADAAMYNAKMKSKDPGTVKLVQWSEGMVIPDNVPKR